MSLSNQPSLHTGRVSSEKREIQIPPESPNDAIKTDISDLQCTICFVNQRNAVVTDCGHTFCLPCIRRITKQTQKICPICDGDITTIIKIF